MFWGVWLDLMPLQTLDIILLLLLTLQSSAKTSEAGLLAAIHVHAVIFPRWSDVHWTLSDVFHSPHILLLSRWSRILFSSSVKSEIFPLDFFFMVGFDLCQSHVILSSSAVFLHNSLFTYSLMLSFCGPSSWTLWPKSCRWLTISPICGRSLNYCHKARNAIVVNVLYAVVLRFFFTGTTGPKHVQAWQHPCTQSELHEAMVCSG